MPIEYSALERKIQHKFDSSKKISPQHLPSHRYGTPCACKLHAGKENI
jgi:hypothetical protein